jgi:hypothetical protein
MKVNPATCQLAHSVARSLTIIRAMLKEIFEESAYARFLERHKLSSSREAYAIFLRETEATRVRRPRCC